MTLTYRNDQIARAAKLIREGEIFRGAKGGELFRGQKRDYVLQKEENNFCPFIYEEAIDYFAENEIAWWGGQKPTGNVLSSQIACLNHLFWFRHDRAAVWAVAQTVCSDLVEVYEIKSDKEGSRGYIQFEAISDKDHLNEGEPQRGSHCTSIDALIYAGHRDGSEWLILLEWKYTEFLDNSNKALEGTGVGQNPANSKGEERKRRYTELINQSGQLKHYSDHTCYYEGTFYQFMRQTLWAEQMIRYKDVETLQADNFLHVLVVPEGNEAFREKAKTWSSHLQDPSRFSMVTPEQLLEYVDRAKYSDEIKYLEKRYWNK